MLVVEAWHHRALVSATGKLGIERLSWNILNGRSRAIESLHDLKSATESPEFIQYYANREMAEEKS